MTINGDGIVMRKMDIFCLNQITHIIRNCYALKMLKNQGYSDESVFPLFLHISYIQEKGWKWYQCYDCGYIVKQASVFFPTYQACIIDAEQECIGILVQLSEKT